MDKIRDIKEDILNQNDELLVQTLIFGDNKLSRFGNTEILNSSIEFTLATKTFDVPLLQNDSLLKIFNRLRYYL